MTLVLHGSNEQSTQIILAHCLVIATHPHVLLEVWQLLQCTHKATLLLIVDTEPLIDWVELVAKLHTTAITHQVSTQTDRHCTIEKERISSLFGAILFSDRPSNSVKKSLAMLQLNWTVMSCYIIRGQNKQTLAYLTQLAQVCKNLVHICYFQDPVEMKFL